MVKGFVFWAVTITLMLAGCAAPTNTPGTSQTGNASNPNPTAPSKPAPTEQSKAAPTAPRKATWTVKPPKHILIVVEENHSYSEIVGNPKAPYINALLRKGASLADYHGVEHPSEPNYLDLFSGSNQGVTNDSCPHTFSTPNLASELVASHFTFGGYSEDLPSIGYKGCSNGHLLGTWGATYARKHNPWVNFTNVPSGDNMPFTSFPRDFSKLPTVSFVIPNLQHDMHDGSVQVADAWLQQNIRPYVECRRHMTVCS